MAASPMRAVDRDLADAATRRIALSACDRSLLVEAGAGSGKTAILAGRIAVLLAAGVAPRHIAAVTFTELAASELLARARTFVTELARGRVPPELHGAFPNGASADARKHLAQADVEIDEITCTTIHGFCERLIAPYPVEADMDPGARVMDRDQIELVFTDVSDAWLQERLSIERGEVLDELVKQRPRESIDLIHQVLRLLRQRRSLACPPTEPLAPCIGDFLRAVAAFSVLLAESRITETETATIATLFREMSEAIAPVAADGSSAVLVRLLSWAPHPDLCREDGAFRAFRRKGKWVEAAKRAGIAKADGERLYREVEEAYQACCTSWTRMRGRAAAIVLAALTSELLPVLRRFQDHKRSAALLDFDDLIHIACALLRDHPAVRRALADRYSHVLVDEFQDTDLTQIEILWRLCGEPVQGVTAAEWTDYRIRPGALFLVGDPKQAIYRFRGADIAAYLRARELFRAHDAASIVSITTNFRSREPILDYVNDRFHGLLSGAGQPGFTPLVPFHAARHDGPCVAALDVSAAEADGKAPVERQRRAEADAVARLCASLIGAKGVADRKTGIVRPCRAADIALLAPTGTELWRYEEALEGHGIAVATQAGKGLFRRQEIQDLITLTRVLADPRDTLALGALLRGPLVGLTDGELLDITWGLPRPQSDTHDIPRLDIHTSPEAITHSLARDILAQLQSLRRRAEATTPHAILSRAIDVLQVRPILLQRHRRNAERALANVDLYLDLARAYAVRGLRAFSQAMTAAWADEARAVEGRPDTQEDAVALFTIHAAKGLEWPIVVPVNAMTAARGPDGALVEGGSDRLCCPIFGVAPVGYEAAREAEKADLQRERTRLWYVALTRARELLIIPRLDVASPASAWISVLDMSLEKLPALDVPDRGGDLLPGGPRTDVSQTRETFEREAAAIRRSRRSLAWLAPSRDEDDIEREEAGEEFMVLTGDEQPGYRRAAPDVHGGRDRGVVVHKLLEEVLTGEIDDDPNSIISRAETLIRSLGRSGARDPSHALSAAEIGGCVTRALALPQVAELLPTLTPEVPVYALDYRDDGSGQVIVGVADALSVDETGMVRHAIDWKSDVEPTAAILGAYRAQMSAYLRATGLETGLLVFVTSGTVLSVTAS